jgi:hypothetical protein
VVSAKVHAAELLGVLPNLLASICITSAPFLLALNLGSDIENSFA